MIPLGVICQIGRVSAWKVSDVLQGSGEAAGSESQLREVGGGHGSLCDKHFIFLTGNLPQSVPHHRPPAQPCWPVCRGPRTHQANTWPARARAWSCGSVSGSPHPAQYPLRLSPSSAHPESTGLCFCSWTHQPCPTSDLCRAVPRQGRNALRTPALSGARRVPLGLCSCSAGSLEASPTVAPTSFVWPAPTGCDRLPSSLV